MPESRCYNAEYYDASSAPDDIKFYEKLCHPDMNVLELGCGTGRVSIPLRKKVKALTAIDISESMLSAARSKDKDDSIDFVLSDITTLDLGKKFDMIIAPFRVIQALETDKQLEGFLSVIKNHLSANGTAILNAFNPKYSKEEMKTKWLQEDEISYGEMNLPNGDLLKLSCTQNGADWQKQVLHPEMIYRRYRNGTLIDEHVNPICMRYWYPSEFKDLIEKSGFQITDTWGGYQEQIYGKGSELVVAFKLK